MSDADDATVQPVGEGRFLVLEGDRRRLAFAVRGRSEAWVFLDGRVFVVADTPPGAARTAIASDETALSAPMPATVVAVHVTVGSRVDAGDALVTLEAMKMELAIRAATAGVVRRVACRPGDLVQPGEPLVELE